MFIYNIYLLRYLLHLFLINCNLLIFYIGLLNKLTLKTFQFLTCIIFACSKVNRPLEAYLSSFVLTLTRVTRGGFKLSAALSLNFTPAMGHSTFPTDEWAIHPLRRKECLMSKRRSPRLNPIYQERKMTVSTTVWILMGKSCKSFWQPSKNFAEKILTMLNDFLKEFNCIFWLFEKHLIIFLVELSQL